VSLPVELARVLAVAAGYRTVPMLLSTDSDGRPRAAAVTLTWDGTVARVRAGHRSVANAAARPLVSLLWPAPPGQPHALLVDGEAVETLPDPSPDEPAPKRSAKPGGVVVIRATAAILHVVDKPGSGSGSC
jgi:hypothetical protein